MANASQTPPTNVTASTASRASSGRTSAGSSARSGIASERSGMSIGDSRRSHAVVITTAGTNETKSVLGNARLSPGERCTQVVARLHDGNGNADGLQPQQLRLGLPRRVDVDERGAATRQGTLHEPVGERDVERRRYDDELERAGGDAAVRLEERERRRPRRRLRPGEQL